MLDVVMLVAAVWLIGTATDRLTIKELAMMTIGVVAAMWFSLSLLGVR